MTKLSNKDLSLYSKISPQNEENDNLVSKQRVVTAQDSLQTSERTKSNSRASPSSKHRVLTSDGMSPARVKTTNKLSKFTETKKA